MSHESPSARLSALERRAELGGGADRIARQHAAGKLTARERIERLFDPGTFEEVDKLVHTALAEGGRPAMPAMDHGFMYGWSFYDLDGHHWEVMWMDPGHVQPQA